MTRRFVCVIAVCAAVVIGSWSREATARGCYPTFGYGNVGYSAGYSMQRVGFCGPRWGGWCAPRAAWCGPRWGGWCAPRFNWGGWCGPRWGWGCRPWGWRSACYAPAYSYGCSYGWPVSYGTSWYPSCESIYYSSPVGGSFFSGGLIPFPTIGYGYPAVVPGFVSTNTVATPVANLASVRPALPQVQQVAATIRDLRSRRAAAQQTAVAPTAVAQTATRGRPSNAIARLRAARLVAVGDRQLRDAKGDPTLVRRAVDSYRRAGAIAGDQPDTFVREAIALVALGERGQADAAMAKAVAIDGRLADLPPARGNQPPDPVFGDRSAEAEQPLAARGKAVLRQIGAETTAGDSDPAVQWLAGRWADRFGGVLNAVASNGRRVE
ncbi:MAG: hypothetical protein K8S94_04600 [Planctomycetia bacterium]|nr:hypothetical protein [Planctomycetia bacterium]